MPLRFDPALSALHVAAIIEATRRRHAQVTIEHLALVATREAATAGLLRAAGADPIEIGRDIADYLDLAPPLPARSYRPPSTAPLLARAVLRAARHARAAQRHDLRVGDVLVAITREPTSYAAITLGAAGVSRVELLRAVAHGQRDYPLPIAGASARRARVILYNDDFTTMEFVVAVLEAIFELPPSEAARLMLRVHEKGATEVGEYDFDEAVARARRVLRLAEENDYPLRVSVE